MRNDNLPNTIIENPMTNTRFRTFPTAWVRGATLSSVLFASCSLNPHKIIKNKAQMWIAALYSFQFSRIFMWI
jgi:hypothetical protein